MRIYIIIHHAVNTEESLSYGENHDSSRAFLVSISLEIRVRLCGRPTARRTAALFRCKFRLVCLILSSSSALVSRPEPLIVAQRYQRLHIYLQ